MVETFREQLIELWQGNIHHKREAVNYALDGQIRNVLLQFTVFPVMKRLGIGTGCAYRYYCTKESRKLSRIFRPA